MLGRRTEGLIPPDESQPNGPESLENELGKVMYEQLADENELLRREIAELKKMEDERKESERLRAELEGLKRKIAGQEGRSSTSWSEVGVEEHYGQPPPKTPRVQKPEACGDDRRFTPGGTQVPPGLPPDEVPGPPLPPWPPWMSPVEEYQSIEESFRYGKIGDATPRWMPERVGEPTPEQVRMMWLEREVQTLGKVLRNQAHGSWDDRYWSKRVHQWPSLDGQDASQAAFGELHHQGRASTEHGELRHQGRASTEHGELFHQGRASTEHGELRHQGRAGIEHGELPHQDRAGTEHGGLSHGDRAGAEHGGLCHGDRAGTEHDGLCHGDRADGKQPELLQRDRAGFDGGDLHHGRGQGQGLCGGQGHGQDHGSGGYPPYPGVEQSGQGSKLELPALPQEITPMDLGDWLTLITPSMKDIANNASVWWESTLAAATTFYEEWRQSTPLQRVQLRPVLPAELKARSFERTEHRGVGLLLRALPTEMRSTIISNRDMSSTSILWRLLITYQPGGSGEKGQLLKVLTTSSTSSTASQLASHLRQWRRCFTRAREI